MTGNGEAFNGISTIAFAKLYESFPRPIDLHGNDLAAVYAEKAGIEDEESLQQLFDLGDHSLHWLVSEGFIRYAAHLRTLDNNPSHPGAVLTLRALDVLRKRPDAINEESSKTIGERAGEALIAGTKTAIAAVSEGVFAAVLEQIKPRWV